MADVTPAFRLSVTVELLPLLNDAAGSTAPLQPVRTTGHALAIPWLLLGLIAVGLAAVWSVQHLGWVVRARRRA